MPEEDEQYFSPSKYARVNLEKYGDELGYLLVFPYPLAYVSDLTGIDTRMYLLPNEFYGLHH